MNVKEKFQELENKMSLLSPAPMVQEGGAGGPDFLKSLLLF